MIRKECFTTEWIEKVSSELHYNDNNLIEKVIRALSLLEMLVMSGCPFVFKGGTALMLILGKSANRLSIDIDIICPPGTNIEDYLTAFADFGFTDLEFVERRQRNGADVPKSHPKFFYQVTYRSLDTDVQQVFNDIRQTALCISTRGKAGEGDFELIQDGIIRVKAFMYRQRYMIDHAIIDSSRAAYLATLIEKGIADIQPYPDDPAVIKDLIIRPSLTNRLNKLKANLPEAYYYWAKTSELLEE